METILLIKKIFRQNSVKVKRVKVVPGPLTVVGEWQVFNPATAQWASFTIAVLICSQSPKRLRCYLKIENRPISASVRMQFSTWYFCCPDNHPQRITRWAACRSRMKTGWWALTREITWQIMSVITNTGIILEQDIHRHGLMFLSLFSTPLGPLINEVLAMAEFRLECCLH